MAVGYNLNHLQVAPVPATGAPVFVDVAGVVSWEPSITTENEEVLADGQVYLTAYGAPAGEGDFVFIDSRFAVLGVVNGGMASSSGTGATKIDRYEQPGQYTAPPFIMSDWVPNIDLTHSPLVAGMRTTVPNATAEVATRTSGQQTVFEWTAATRFTAPATGPMIIYEQLATEPTFTGGVTDVNLTAPA